MSSWTSAKYSVLKCLRTAFPFRRLPVVLQLSTTDCGPASLAIVLEFHGKYVSLSDIRAILSPGRDGVDAAAIIQAGCAYGLRGRGVQIDVKHMRQLPMGSILYWRSRHFVVFERARKTHIDIVDPAFGRQSVPIAEFFRGFGGVALIFESDQLFQPHRERSQWLFPFVRSLLQSRDLLFSIGRTPVLIQATVAFLPLLLRLIVDRAAPYRDKPVLIQVFIGYCTFQGFAVLSGFLHDQSAVRLRRRLETTFTLRYLRHLVTLPYSFIKQHAAMDIICRLENNAVPRPFLLSATMSLLLDGLMACLYYLLLYLGNSRLALIALALVGGRIALLIMVCGCQNPLLNKMRSNEIRIKDYQNDIVAGMETLKSMGLEIRAANEWKSYFLEGLSISISREQLDVAFGASLKLLKALTNFFFVFYIAHMVLQHHLTLGRMVEIGALAASLFTLLDNSANTIVQLQAVNFYSRRLHEMLGTPSEKSSQNKDAPEEIRGSISLNGVSFRYSKGSPVIVNNVSFEILANSHVALVGKSGSGKSTLARLLTGLYEPNDGTIFYDGHDLKVLDRRRVRRNVGVVTQEVQLFAGSIRYNIAFADPQMDFSKVLRAAKIAGIHDEIMQMPMGYETSITHRGESLSGGQRQRIALSRAIANEPVILLLDEATSHLDATTELQINRSLALLQCTRIVIAHRLSTVRNADLIVVLEKGCVVEMGKHEDLCVRKGLYSALIAEQQKY